jgi:hypothetical protein
MTRVPAWSNFGRRLVFADIRAAVIGLLPSRMMG